MMNQCYYIFLQDRKEAKEDSVRYFTSYATAERYDLDGLKRYLQGSDFYSLSLLPEGIAINDYFRTHLLCSSMHLYANVMISVYRKND